MKYSKNFERDWEWYNKYKYVFTFDGATKKEIVEDLVNGKTAKECFYIFDSQGKMPATKDKEQFLHILKCKGSINFQIKEWAQDRAKGYLPKILFKNIIEEFELLDWMVEATERQKYKYYDIRNL